MATIEDAIYSRLSNFAGLTALVGTRIYPNLLPQDVTMPAVSYRGVSPERISAMGSDTGIVRGRFQFDCWDRDDASGGGFDGAVAVREQVRKALQRWRATEAGVVIQDSFVLGGPDLYEPETKTHHLVIDFEIIHVEA